MDNTIENKAKFFAQYYGQKVMKADKTAVLNCDPLAVDHGDWYLELYPLSSISDEDKIEINRIEGLPDDEEEEAYLIFGTDWGFCYYRNGSFIRFLLIESYQYLQSKGYALPYMELSVEKQIEYGWVKIKEREVGNG